MSDDEKLCPRLQEIADSVKSNRIMHEIITALNKTDKSIVKYTDYVSDEPLEFIAKTECHVVKAGNQTKRFRRLFNEIHIRQNETDDYRTVLLLIRKYKLFDDDDAMKVVFSEIINAVLEKWS